MYRFALLFPGQGMQFPKMGEFFYNNYTAAKRVFTEASDTLGWSVDRLCYKGSVTEINQFGNMQILILTTEIAMYRCFLQDYGVKPYMSMGHSIGEYASLVCAGYLTIENALRILKKRGELVEGLIPRQSERMCIVENINEERLRYFLKEEGMEDSVYISCYNSYSQHAVCGDEDELIRLGRILSTEGARSTPLLSSPPMHSRYMSSVKEEFNDYLNQFTFSSPAYPVVSNVLGKPFENTDKLSETLAEHLIKPVLWADSSDNLRNNNILYTIEISPRSLVTPFIKENQPDINSFCYGLNKDRSILESILA